MNVRNCRKCGRIFNYVSGTPICPACREAEEEKFQEVKKYVQDHTGASVAEVAEACDVTTNQIQAWLRDERLELCEGSGIGLNCENCGATILTGRYCAKCKAAMAERLESSIRRPEPPKPKQPKDMKDNPKMRFL